jgi:hypothetical protein
MSIQDTIQMIGNKNIFQRRENFAESHSVCIR